MNHLAPYLAFTRNTLNRHKFQAAVLVAAVAAAGSAHLVAQQSYPYPAPSQNPYAYSQPAAPGQPYGDAQPPYDDPHYSQPQYAQSQQYADPQYAQPQFGQQQPNAQLPSEESPYPSEDQMQPEPTGQQAQPPLNADELEQLVAPIALYPDALLAQILTASTYPAQVSIADQWLQQMQAQGYGAPEMVANGADAQADWDPSIKALTAFPQVLDMLNHNLEWTVALGNAYYNQPNDVMQTVQVMRERAAAAGTLQSTPQESVSNVQGNIELAPANPQEVYVPAYDPWDVYGQPISPYPGFSLVGALGSFFAGPPISYGLGIALAAFDRFPWGFLGWAFDWHSHDVMFGHNPYFTHSASVADWGFPHGGPRAYGSRGQSPRISNGDRGAQAWNRSGNSYDRGQSFNRAERPGQSFNRPDQQFNRPEQSYGRPAEEYNRPLQPPIRPQESLIRPSNPFNRATPYSGTYGYQRSYTRPEAPQQEAFNRVAPNFSRPQPYAGAQAYGRSPYAFGYANRPAQTFTERPGTTYGRSPYQTYRAPQAAAPRAFAQTQPRSFSPFSRGSEPRSYGGSFSSHAPRSFGGGGGHFSAPRASHSGGGGHSSGGHSGGGHRGR